MDKWNLMRSCVTVCDWMTGEGVVCQFRYNQIDWLTEILSSGFSLKITWYKSIEYDLQLHYLRFSERFSDSSLMYFWLIRRFLCLI